MLLNLIFGVWPAYGIEGSGSPDIPDIPDFPLIDDPGGEVIPDDPIDFGQQLIDSLGSVSDSVIGALGDILPAALAVVGIILAVTIGVKLFKRFAK